MFVALAPHRPPAPAIRARESRRWRQDALPLALAAVARKASRRKVVLGLGHLCGSASAPSIAASRIETKTLRYFKII